MYYCKKLFELRRKVELVLEIEIYVLALLSISLFCASEPKLIHAIVAFLVVLMIILVIILCYTTTHSIKDEKGREVIKLKGCYMIGEDGNTYAIASGSFAFIISRTITPGLVYIETFDGVFGHVPENVFK